MARTAAYLAGGLLAGVGGGMVAQAKLDHETNMRNLLMAFQREERVAGQEFRTGEREATQEFQSGEAETERDFRSDEAARGRDFTATENKLGRQHQTSERVGGQEFRTGERVAGEGYHTREREAGERFRTGEREGEQRFRTGERESTQDFQKRQTEAEHKFREQESERARQHQTGLLSNKREVTDGQGYLWQIDAAGHAKPVTQPDGSQVRGLPGGAKASDEPSDVRTARILVKEGVYPDLETAWKEVKTRADTSPAQLRQAALRAAQNAKSRAGLPLYDSPEKMAKATEAYEMILRGEIKAGTEALKAIDDKSAAAADEPGFLGRVWRGMTGGGTARPPGEADAAPTPTPGPAPQGGRFNPESSGYDDARARSSGMRPAGPEAGENVGHMGSVAETTAEEKRRYGLPADSYILLKGRQHPTWDKAVDAEQQRGYQVVKRGDRYFSIPAPTPSPAPAAQGQPPGTGTRDDPYKATTQAHIEYFKKNAPKGAVIDINGKLYTK